MKYAILAVSAAVLIAPSYSAAQTDSNSPIEIEASRVTIAQWAAGVSRSLDQNLEYPSYFGRMTPESGYASISFRIGEDGKASAVILRHSSGSPRLDNAAMMAVRGLEGMGQVPGANFLNQRVRANIIFATDGVTLDRLERKVRHDTANMAQSPGTAGEIALTVSANAAAG